MRGEGKKERNRGERTLVLDAHNVWDGSIPTQQVYLEERRQRQ